MSDNDGYHNLSGAMEGSLSVGSLRVLLILLTPLGLNPSNSRNLKPRLSRVEGRLLRGLCLPRNQCQDNIGAGCFLPAFQPQCKSTVGFTSPQICVRLA